MRFFWFFPADLLIYHSLEKGNRVGFLQDQFRPVRVLTFTLNWSFRLIKQNNLMQFKTGVFLHVRGSLAACTSLKFVKLDPKHRIENLGVDQVFPHRTFYKDASKGHRTWLVENLILCLHLIEQWLNPRKCYLCKLFVGQNSSVRYWIVYFTNHILCLLAFADVSKEEQPPVVV